jgi:hypothetical protein
MSEGPETPRAPSTTRRLGALLLMAVGALVAALCGACTVNVISDILFGDRTCPNLPPGNECGAAIVASDPAFSIGIALVVGGLPAILGLALLWAGWNAWPRARRSGSPEERPARE